MDIEVNGDGKTEDYLRRIAKLKDCSINTAAELILKRYAQRTMAQIEGALSVSDKVSNPQKNHLRVS
jgi:hypothetical protein